jgi:hypothetical protein
MLQIAPSGTATRLARPLGGDTSSANRSTASMTISETNRCCSRAWLASHCFQASGMFTLMRTVVGRVVFERSCGSLPRSFPAACRRRGRFAPAGLSR